MATPSQLITMDEPSHQDRLIGTLTGRCPSGIKLLKERHGSHFMILQCARMYLYFTDEVAVRYLYKLCNNIGGWNKRKARGMLDNPEVDEREYWMKDTSSLRNEAQMRYTDFKRVGLRIRGVLGPIFEGCGPVLACDPFAGNREVTRGIEKGLGDGYDVLSSDVFDHDGVPAHMAVQKLGPALDVLILSHPPPGQMYGDYLAIEAMKRLAVSRKGSRPTVVVFIGEMGQSDGTESINDYMSSGLWKVKCRVPIYHFYNQFGLVVKWLTVFEYNIVPPTRSG